MGDVGVSLVPHDLQKASVRSTCSWHTGHVLLMDVLGPRSMEMAGEKVV